MEKELKNYFSGRLSVSKTNLLKDIVTHPAYFTNKTRPLRAKDVYQHAFAKFIKDTTGIDLHPMSIGLEITNLTDLVENMSYETKNVVKSGLLKRNDSIETFDLAFSKSIPLTALEERVRIILNNIKLENTDWNKAKDGINNIFTTHRPVDLKISWENYEEYDLTVQLISNAFSIKRLKAFFLKAFPELETNDIFGLTIATIK